MKLGILYIVLGATIIALAICVSISEDLSLGISGVGKLVVGILLSLWLLPNGIARIRRAKTNG